LQFLSIGCKTHTACLELTPEKEEKDEVAALLRSNGFLLGIPTHQKADGKSNVKPYPKRDSNGTLPLPREKRGEKNSSCFTCGAYTICKKKNTTGSFDETRSRPSPEDRKRGMGNYSTHVPASRSSASRGSSEGRGQVQGSTGKETSRCRARTN